jgi:hypothetical protein
VLVEAWGKPIRVRLPLIGGVPGDERDDRGGARDRLGRRTRRGLRRVAELTGVRGRMQLAGVRDNGAPVYVDYAHTPDALETALKALRPHVLGRLHVVFGAGGDRDRGKRPLMGQAARQGRCGDRHRRQPPLRGPRRDPGRRFCRAAPKPPRSATGPRRSCAPSTGWRRATRS